MLAGIVRAQAGLSIVLLMGSVALFGGLASPAQAIPPCGWYVGRCIEDSADSDCIVSVHQQLTAVSCAAAGKRVTVYEGNLNHPGKNQATCTVDTPGSSAADGTPPPYECDVPILDTIAIVPPVAQYVAIR
jgi:hypothetical protein